MDNIFDSTCRVQASCLLSFSLLSDDDDDDMTEFEDEHSAAS